MPNESQEVPTWSNIDLQRGANRVQHGAKSERARPGSALMLNFALIQKTMSVPFGLQNSFRKYSKIDANNFASKFEKIIEESQPSMHK